MNPLLIKLSVLLGILQIALAAPANETNLILPPVPNGVFSLVYKYIPENAELALRIIKAESNFKETATTSLSSAKGYAQILDGTARHFNCKGSMLDGEANIACMAKILKKAGTAPWSASAKVWDTD